ncbi:hypothetical protein BJ684DRAFT_16394, partial [Piptocephalis cylindrospora]
SNDDTDYSPELPVESEPSATGDVEGDTDNQSPDSAPSDYPSDDQQHGGDRPTPVKVTYSTTTLPVEEPQAESTPAAVDGASDSQELGYGQPDNTGVDGASDSQDPANETVESPPATPGGDNVSYGTTY